MPAPDFFKKPSDRITPGWVVDPEKLRAICPTCKARVEGSVDGLIKHLQKAHGVKPPKVEFVPNE